MNLSDFVSTSLFFLVIINPVSKVALLTALSQTHSRRELQRLSRDSCAVGFALLVAFAFAGRLILRDVFHIQLYSIQVAGGAGIFLIGFQALREGSFFRLADDEQLATISASPVGMPMIAGPAAIAAVISAAATHSPVMISLAIVPGMAVNLAMMLAASGLGAALLKWRVLGPLVRITGLFMAAIGTEMILTGLGTWLKA